MEEYVITKKDLKKWCSIPLEELKKRDDLKMQLHVHKEKDDVFKELGDVMADTVIRNNKLNKPTSFILSTGGYSQYRYFIERVNKERISLHNVYGFVMDTSLNWEGRPYGKENPRFNIRKQVERMLYDHIDDELNVPEENRYYPDPVKPDEIDEKIDELGYVDLLIGGVGCKGLVAMNEDKRNHYYRITNEEFRNSRSRVVFMNDDTIVAYAQRNYGGCYDAQPPMMFTIGMRSMLKSRKAFFAITTGAWKQTVIRVALFAEPTMEYPVTFFSEYVKDCIIGCDEVSADHCISKDPYQEYLFE